MANKEIINISPEKAREFSALQREAKDLASQGYLQESLDLFLKAKEIYPSKKVLSRIQRLKDALKKLEEEEDSDEDDEMVQVADGFQLFRGIHDKLFPYQREGVAWLWNLYRKGKGGILGDDMGLGKTIQVIAFLSGMIDAQLVKSALIIMPVSLLQNWKKEFQKWCPGIPLYEFHGTSKKEREQNLNRVQRRGGVIITSYGMIIGNHEIMSILDGHSFIWDYVILDEGHKIKNPTKTTKAVHELPSKNRIVLTGTPVQNNLQELWALFDFAHHGTLLGSCKTFKMQYENPISRSREKDCSKGERELGTLMADNLKNLIKPYFLRRTKEILEQQKKTDTIEELGQELGKMKVSTLSKKNDFIIWVFLSQPQYSIYTDFLESESVQRILTDKRSPLMQLTILKKICDHPRLLSHRSCLQLGLNGSLSEEQLARALEDENSGAITFENVSDETLIEESGKLEFTINLLENLRQNGHRTLVFSLSRKILDMIHRILCNRQWKVLRVDGTISKMEEREKRIQLFQRDSSYPVFLLTTQVGGVGITLTAADRVIIYDPSWNPATDAQAVDRVYRIGQKKNVVVYRLITCGSIEEKIYRRQIFKDSITRQATGSSLDPHRYFSKQELRELFTVDNIHYSHTQVQLASLHAKERKTDVDLDEHIAFLHSLNIFGISDHDLMFSKEIKDHNDDDDDKSVTHDYIKKRVEMAEMLVRNEANVLEEGLKKSLSYVKPYTLHIPSSVKKSGNNDMYRPPQFLDDMGDFRENVISLKSPNSRVSEVEESSGFKSNNASLADKSVEIVGEKKSLVKSLFSGDVSSEHLRDVKTSKSRENITFESESPVARNMTRHSSLDTSGNPRSTTVKDIDNSMSSERSYSSMKSIARHSHERDSLLRVSSLTSPLKENSRINVSKNVKESSIENLNVSHKSDADGRIKTSLLVNDGDVSRNILSELGNISVSKSTPIQDKILIQKNDLNSETAQQNSVKKHSIGQNLSSSFTNSGPSEKLVFRKSIKGAINESFEDLDIFNEVVPQPKAKALRKSCANPRKSAVMLSDSDSSIKTVPSTENSFDVIVSESESSENEESFDAGLKSLDESEQSDNLQKSKTSVDSDFQKMDWLSDNVPGHQSSQFPARKTMPATLLREVQNSPFNTRPSGSRSMISAVYHREILESPISSSTPEISINRGQTHVISKECTENQDFEQDAISINTPKEEMYKTSENNADDVQKSAHNGNLSLQSVNINESSFQADDSQIADRLSMNASSALVGASLNDDASILDAGSGPEDEPAVDVSYQNLAPDSEKIPQNASYSIRGSRKDLTIDTPELSQRSQALSFESDISYSQTAVHSHIEVTDLPASSPKKSYTDLVSTPLPNLSVRNRDCSPICSGLKRITPMRVFNEKPSPKKTPFEKAMEKSVEFPACPPQKAEKSIASDFDSPIPFVKKTARKILDSDSEDEVDNSKYLSFKNNDMSSEISGVSSEIPGDENYGDKGQRSFEQSEDGSGLEELSLNKSKEVSDSETEDTDQEDDESYNSSEEEEEISESDYSEKS